jgi:hypothetical protein
MQGCMTLYKVLTMIQIHEAAKYPDGRPEHQSLHVEEPNFDQKVGVKND